MKLLTKILLGFFLACIPVNRLTFAWTTPVNISNTPGISNFASLALDSLGNVHVVWTDDTYGNNEILYCYLNGENWSVPVNISKDSTDSQEPDIIIDAQGHPHVSWTDWQTGEILWTFFDGTTWSSPINIKDYVGFSVSPSLAADDSSRVFIAWHNLGGQSDIYFSIYDGISWSVPQNLTDDPEDSAFPDIVVGSKGYVHLVWKDYDDLDIHYSKYEGESWTSDMNISQLTGQSCDPKVTLDSQDHPHVVWEERKEGYHIYYTFYDGQDWVPSYRISSGHNPSISHDFETYSHIVWGDDYIIFHSFGSDTSWSIPFNISNSPDMRCLCPEIDFDSGGILHVVWAYWDEQYHSEIFYSSNALTDVEEQPERFLPQGYQLEQNYPNPFNAETVIRYSIAGHESVRVRLNVYNLLGEKVITLIDKMQSGGDYEVIWDGRNWEGGDVSSGVYFCRLRVGGFLSTRKMLLLR
jgi:hypothetical protein